MAFEVGGGQVVRFVLVFVWRNWLVSCDIRSVKCTKTKMKHAFVAPSSFDTT